VAADRPASGHPGFWFVLLLAGQAASLQLIQAGKSVGYQHYVRVDQLLDLPSAWWALGVGLQGFLAAWALWRHRARTVHLLGFLRGWRLVIVALAFVLTSATLSRSPWVLAQELVLASLIQGIHLATAIALGLSLTEAQCARARHWIDRTLGTEHDEFPVPGGPDRFAWVLALGVTGVAALLAVVAYQRHPHVPDEVVYLLQARYLAAGHLSLPLPPVAEAFNIDLLTYQASRWFSPVPPGWPMILSAGAFLGVPWLVNPVLAGISVLLAAMLLRELYPRRTVRLVLLLLAASPWHLFMAMSFMTHTATLTAALLAALGVARLRRDPRLRWAVAGGIGIGIIGLIRPLEGIAVAGLLGVWSLGARGRRWRLLPSATLTLVTMGVGALVLPYNAHLTGSPRTFPIMEYTDAHFGPGANALGFGANRGLGWPGLDPLPGHGAADVAINANLNLFQVNIELHGWAIGSLLVLALMIVAGPMRRPDWWMVVAVAGITGIHALYYFSGGPDFGARYWFLILVPCLVLSARGLEFLRDSAERRAAGSGIRVLLVGAALVVITLTTFVPWRAADKYHHYRGMRPDPRTLAATPGLRDAILLVRGRRHPDYASAAVYNPLDLSGPDPIFAWDRGPEVRSRLVAAFPGRSFYIVDGPTLTGRGYEVTAGPLTGDQLRQRRDSLSP